MNKKKKLKLNKKPRALVTLTDSQSIISEQFRSIRANINFSLPGEEIKTILITSSTPGEGKSTIAANLAIVFAQENKKVLLVDADMRKPSLHYTFKLENKAGLSNILSGRNYIYNAIQETPVDGLNIIPSGPIPPNPTELLTSKYLEGFIDEVKKDYDLMIIDSPPLLTLSDSLILGNKCDGTLLVVKSGVAEKQNVKKCRDILQSSQAKIIGVILNNYKISSNLKYDYNLYNL